MLSENLYRYLCNLAQGDDFFTRSDLAEKANKDLHLMGSNKLQDTYQLRELVEDAYHRAQSEENYELASRILNTFLSNDLSRPLYDPYAIYQRATPEAVTLTLTETWKTEQPHLQEMQQEIGPWVQQSISALEGSIHKSMELVDALMSKSGSIWSWFSGKQKIKDQQKKLYGLKEQYTNMAASYEEHIDYLRYQISEYEKARAALLDAWKLLLDRTEEIMGPSIRATEPELFDLSQLEQVFIDTSEMVAIITNDCNRIVLEAQTFVENYQQIRTTQRRAIIGEGLNQMGNYLSHNSTHKKSKQEVEEELALIALKSGGALLGNWIDGLMEAKEEAAKIKQRAEEIRSRMLDDAETLLDSMGTSKRISSTLNTHHLPITRSMSREMVDFSTRYLQPAFDAIYADPDVAMLKAKKNQRKQQRKLLQLDISDIEHEQIAAAQAELAFFEECLEEVKPSYQKHMDARPKSPGIIGWVITLGLIYPFYLIAKSVWEKTAVFVIEDFDYYSKQIETTNQYIEQLRTEAESLREEIAAIDDELAAATIELHKVIRQAPEAQALREHLKPLVHLLKNSKEVLSVAIY